MNDDTNDKIKGLTKAAFGKWLRSSKGKKAEPEVGHAHHCVIAEYLRDVGYVDAEVDCARIVVTERGAHSDRELRVRTPAWADKVIDAFDNFMDNPDIDDGDAVSHKTFYPVVAKALRE